VGGGALLPFRPGEQAFASDVIPELIALWLAIRDRPEEVADGYGLRWRLRQQKGHVAYYEIRDNFNKGRDPVDLLFLSRTCVNGLIRFNKEGDFNNSLHHTRPGIAPDKLRKAILDWSRAIQGVQFAARDYRVALNDAAIGDFVFLDPPYHANRGRYRPTPFDSDTFYRELENLNSNGIAWMLTYDGSAGQRDYTGELPLGLYKRKLQVPTGHSPFTRLMGKTLDNVKESVYLNYDPPSEALRQFMEDEEKPLQLGATFDV
jgi:DNA adenine methylase